MRTIYIKFRIRDISSQTIVNEEKRSEETQTLQVGCSKVEPKISPRNKPPSRGCGRAKIVSAGDGHHRYLQTPLGEDRCMQFRVIMVTDPHTQTHTPTNKQTVLSKVDDFVTFQKVEVFAKNSTF